MNDILKSVLDAAKSSRDVLALLGIGVLMFVGVATGRIPLHETLVIGTFLGLLWLSFRHLLAQFHAKERLHELRRDAKIQAITLLAKHIPKNEVRSTIESLMKDADK